MGFSCGYLGDSLPREGLDEGGAGQAGFVAVPKATVVAEPAQPRPGEGMTVMLVEKGWQGLGGTPRYRSVSLLLLLLTRVPPFFSVRLLHSNSGPLCVHVFRSCLTANRKQTCCELGRSMPRVTNRHNLCTNSPSILRLRYSEERSRW